jgi:hypothetical protein
MNAILERVRDSVPDDKTALGVGLSLLNVASISPAAMKAMGSLVAELDPDTPPARPADFQLPGARFLGAVKGLGLTIDDQYALLADYFDMVADDPSYSMEEFLATILGDDAVTADGAPLDVDRASGYFKRALRRHPRWSKIPGFHTLRHSLASILASRGPTRGTSTRSSATRPRRCAIATSICSRRAPGTPSTGRSNFAGRAG